LAAAVASWTAAEAAGMVKMRLLEYWRERQALAPGIEGQLEHSKGSRKRGAWKKGDIDVPLKIADRDLATSF